VPFYALKINLQGKILAAAGGQIDETAMEHTSCTGDNRQLALVLLSFFVTT